MADPGRDGGLRRRSHGVRGRVDAGPVARDRQFDVCVHAPCSRRCWSVSRRAALPTPGGGAGARQARRRSACWRPASESRAALALLGFERLPDLLLAGLRWSAVPAWVALLQLLLSVGVLLPAMLCIGASFPCALSATVVGGTRVGWQVGRLYAANTAGAVAGVILGGSRAHPGVGRARGAQDRHRRDPPPGGRASGRVGPRRATPRVRPPRRSWRRARWRSPPRGTRA